MSVLSAYASKFGGSGLASSYVNKVAPPPMVKPSTAFQPVDFNKPMDVKNMAISPNAINIGGNSLGKNTSGTGEETPWYQNGKTMQGYADLAGIGLGLAQYFESRKTGKLQRKGLEQNIAKANTDNKFQAVARSNLNAPMVNKSTTGVI
jgi:hypothetical protein